MTLELTFYTVKQVAKILHKDVRTIRIYIHKGEFPKTKFFGNEYLISHDSLIEFLNKHSPDKFAERSI